MTSSKIDIKSLTAELKKSGQANSPKQAKSKKSPAVYSDRSESQHPDGDFIDFINEVNSKDHYHMDRFIYVDADIHEVFHKLKAHTKVRLSYLASYLLEEFILEHQDAIKKLISKNQNKFLD